MPCSTSAKNVSMFFLFLPKSNTCGKRTVRHLLSASITPPGRILTLKSSPHVQPLNSSDARNSPSARTLYDQPKSASADFTTAASSSCGSWYVRLEVMRAGNPNAMAVTIKDARTPTCQFRLRLSFLMLRTSLYSMKIIKIGTNGTALREVAKPARLYVGSYSVRSVLPVAPRMATI